jgi:hypothetical protein
LPLFNRFAQAIIGEPGAPGTLIDGLRIGFKIEKTVKGDPNIAQIMIYGLKASTRNGIKANRDVIILQAGYTDAPDLERLACSMDIFDVRVAVQQPEVITTIICGDGMNKLRNEKLSVSFKGGITVKEIVRTLASNIGATLRNLASVDDAQYVNGFSEAGPPGDLFDKLAGRVNANWSFQNGELEFAPKDAPNTQIFVTIDETTGMVGTPIRRNKVGPVNVPSIKDGWIVRSLLNPAIEPNARVLIRSDVVNAVFRAVTVRHVGDTDGQEWYTEVEAEEYDGA